jgi:hypothetical protein
MGLEIIRSRKARRMAWLSENECRAVLKTYMSLSHTPEEETSRRLAERLSAEELEVAALRSYAYWLTSIRSPGSLTEEIRFATAVREANRHLDGVPFDEAVPNLKASMQFHRERKTMVYRTCMQEDFVYDDQDDSKLATRRRLRIKENMYIQTMVVRGHDKEKNAVCVTLPREETGDDVEGGLDTLIYVIERACACTEALSRGQRDKIVVVVDARNSSAPSIKACQAGIHILQNHYPGRLKNLVVLDLPYVLVGIYNVVKPFLDPDTKSKFKILKGSKQKESALSLLLDKSQATPNLLKNGKLGPAVSSERFVNEVPFHCLYDDVPKATAPGTASDRNMGIDRKMGVTVRVNTLAVGSITQCLSRITVTPISN